MEMLNSSQNQRFFCPIWQVTLKNNRVPLLYYVKLCASFQSQQWIETWVTGQKRSIWAKIRDFLSRVTLRFDGQPWKTIGHLIYSASNFLHHFIAISEFKLDLQSGNTQLGSKSKIFFSCDLEIWQITLKNNRAHLQWYFKFCASFHSQWRIQTGVTLWKHPIWIKINDLSHTTLKFDIWSWKIIGHIFYANSSFMYRFKAIGWFKLELQSGNTQFGSKL